MSEISREEIYDADGDPLPIQHDDGEPGACPICDARREAWRQWFESGGVGPMSDALRAAGDALADEHTETTTQYVVMTTRPDGEVQKIAHEGRERAIEIAQSWRAPEGWGPAWVECIRTVSTTTRTTAWKADEQ